MSQTTHPGYYDALPCPNCGCTELVQYIEKSEYLTVSQDGSIEHIQATHNGRMDEPIEVWCCSCDEKIWDRDE